MPTVAATVACLGLRPVANALGLRVGMIATVGMVRGGVVPRILFPESDNNFLQATVTFPARKADEVSAARRPFERSAGDGDHAAIPVEAIYERAQTAPPETLAAAASSLHRLAIWRATGISGTKRPGNGSAGSIPKELVTTQSWSLE